MKLSKAQRKFMSNIRYGAAIVVVDVIGRTTCSTSGFNRRTFEAVCRNGLLEKTRSTSFGPVGIFEFELTPAGRAALLEAEGAGER